MTTPIQRWVLGLSAAASFMVVLDMLVVATALSTIQRDLHASLADLEWTVNAYVLSFAVLLMTGAALGDRFGRRRMFAAGLALFTAASAACALAPSVGWLIAARTVQGAGAALVMPLALALMNAAFPPERRGWATGVYGGVTGLAATVGPVVGGAVTQGLAWEWIFWLNVPVGLVAVPLVLTRTPESHGTRVTADVPGLLLAAAGAFGVVWALIHTAWVPLLLGLAAVAALVVRERTTTAPMLLLTRGAAAGNAAIFFVNATLTGGIFLAAQLFQVVHHLGPLDAGLRLLPWGVAPLLLGPRAGALADRFGERPLIVAGTALQAVGMAWFGLAAGASYALQVVPMTLSGAGIALAIPAITRAVVSRSAPVDLAKASGTFSTLRQLGGAFGVAVLGAVLDARGYGPALASSAILAAGAVVAAFLLPDRLPDRLPVPVSSPR
ncbi:MFS transporter [Dactylosporangium sp. NPDC049525]|uniref:MFS transporter n=1 Tax=Dactylosporangium sp. NPDC049525 TaxID=3154730 RepID=UPI0034352D80